jgi:sugar O-acyltransferase (sialic acid O-acetyltransferase NeuD family)
MDGLWIVGYRDFGFEVADAAEDAGHAIAGYVEYDSDEELNEQRQAVVLPIDEIQPGSLDRAVFAMTSTVMRQSFVVRIARLTDDTCEPGKVIHPAAIVARHAVMGSGTIVLAGGVIASGAKIGQWCLVNRGATVGHHTQIDDYCTIGPGVNVGGNCEIGRNSYFGIGSTVINRIRIGSHCLIGAGAVVTKDVPDNTQVMGVPARVVKSDFPGL